MIAIRIGIVPKNFLNTTEPKIATERVIKNTEQEIAIITDKIKENTSSGHNLNVDRLREAVAKGELVLDKKRAPQVEIQEV